MLEDIVKYLISLFLLVSFYQPLHAYSYVDSLDNIIDEKVAALAKSFYKVDKIVQTIKKNIKTQVSLQEIEDFLDNKHSVVFFFCNEVQLKIDEQHSDEAAQAQQSFKDLQFVLGAKLYLYYLECAKQKMLYKSVTNYDALHYWQNEKFYEAQSFFQKNILRSLSGVQYKESIDNNITQLEQITKQTDGFLGLIIHNQRLLQKARSQQEFEQSLMESVQSQDDFLHVPHQTYDNYDMSLIIKKSIDQLCRFSVHISAQYAQYQLPSHVVRHWKGYTFTAVGMSIATFIYLRYGDDIKKGSQYFWDEHIKGALQRNQEYFSGVAKPTQFNVESTKDSLQISEDAAKARPFPQGKEDPLDQALISTLSEATGGESTKIYKEVKEGVVLGKQIVRKIVPMVNTVGPVVEEVVPIAKDLTAVYKGVVKPFVADCKDTTLANPFADSTIYEGTRKVLNFHGNLWLSPLLKPVDAIINAPHEQAQSSYQPILLPSSFENSTNDAILPESKQVIIPKRQSENISQKDKDDIILANSLKNGIDYVDALRREVLRKQIEVENQANKISKDMHMVLAITALIPVITLIGGSLFASKSLYNTVAYQPIRTFVRRIELFLNESFYQPITFYGEGHLYFLTEQLKLNVNVLTLPEQKLIDADITALQSPDLDYVQKFNVVQRMYRTYPCLVP
jgi:hypothetical protein